MPRPRPDSLTAAAALPCALTGLQRRRLRGPAATSRPRGVLAAAAAATLDRHLRRQLTLSTDDLPDGINAIQKADGVATDAPAFEGTLTVLLTGQAFEVPVIAVDDQVFAQIPLTPGWSHVDPGRLRRTRPGRLPLRPTTASPRSSAPATDLEKGESVRGGADNNEILTTYTGMVPGDVVAKVIPGASGDFELTAQITDDDELRELSLTGVFYAGADADTYTVGFDDYGTDEGHHGAVSQPERHMTTSPGRARCWRWRPSRWPSRLPTPTSWCWRCRT